MSVLVRLFESQEVNKQPNETDSFWYRDISGYVLPSGKTMSVDAAMRVVAVMACVRCISDTLAMLPLITYRRLKNEGKERASRLPIYNVLHRRPNSWQTPMEFKRQMQANILLRGNAYAQKIFNSNGEISELIPLNPDRIKVSQLQNRRLRYTYLTQDGSEINLSQDMILHLRDFSDDGIVGCTRIHQHARTIGLAIASENHTASTFESGGTKRILLKHPNHFKNPTTANRIRDDFDAKYAGNHRTAVLEEGMDATVIGMTAEDEQLIESRQFSIEEICRIFRVPPHKIQHLLRATFSNIEHQGLEYYTDTLLPWMTLWEEACDRDLIVEDDVFCEFLADAILRADIQTRYNAYGVAIDKGWMNRNEVRIRENLDPAEGLDDFLQPLNVKVVGDPDQNMISDPQEQTQTEIIDNPQEPIDGENT